jgi:GAF domain-containing protein
MNRITQFLAPPVFEDDEDKTRLARLLNTVLLTELAVVLISSFAIPQAEDILVGALSVGVMAFLSLGALLVLRLGYVRLAGGLFSFSMWVFVTVMMLVSGGVSSPMTASYILVVSMAGLLLGGRAAMIITALSAAASIGVFIIELRGSLPAVVIPVTPVVGLSLLIGNIIPVVAVQYLVTRSINTALESARHSNRELQGIRESLEERVAERTRELQETTADLAFRSQEQEAANFALQEARRRQEEINRDLELANERTRRQAIQLRAVVEVGRAMARLRDLGQLLPQVTRLISQHFGFYHVGIFLADEAGRFAVLRAANSEGGGRMLARNHKLAVGAQGVVGYVTGVGEPRVALDVGADGVHFVNPDLPDTRSEVALPLRVGGQTIGALDVQSVEAGAFDEEDVAVLSTLADQVAIAIETARLFQQSQEALAEAEETQRRYLQQAWQGFLAQRPDLQFEYTLEGVTPALDVVLPTTRQAMEQGEPTILLDASAERGDGSTVRAALSVPIKLRGQVIGAIDLHEADEARTWTAHEIALVQAVADQMAQAVETTRLSEQTQARVQREQLVGQITARMTGATSVQDVLQIGSEALGKALGVTRSRVRLQPQEEALS